MAVSAGSRMFLLFFYVLSSTLALPIDIELEDYKRRSDFESSYGEMRKPVDEKRMDPFPDTSENDDYDFNRYQDENLDYRLLERMTNEMLEENGGNLDRKLTDTEYEEISERYFKRLEQERSTENANTWRTPPNTEYGSKIVRTTWATPTRDNTRSKDGNNTTTDHGRTMSHPGVYTTPHQDAISTPGTQRDKWWTTHSYWWTSPAHWDGTLWGLKTAWQTWKQTKASGTDSGKAGGHTKHFDWTGESNSGHRVHVVVYFEK